MSKQESIDGKEEALRLLDEIRKNIEASVDFSGRILMERPSLHPVYQNPLPPLWGGAGHLRYTMELNVHLPQSLPTTTIKEGN